MQDIKNNLKFWQSDKYNGNLGLDSPCLEPSSLAIYSNDPNTELVQFLNSESVSGCQMVQYSNGQPTTDIKQPFVGACGTNHSKTGLNQWSPESCDHSPFNNWTKNGTVFG